MSVCDSCHKNAECLLEGWEPCRKAIAWKSLPKEMRDKDYVATGTHSTWHRQKMIDTEHGKTRPCNRPTGRKIS